MDFPKCRLGIDTVGDLSEKIHLSTTIQKLISTSLQAILSISKKNASTGSQLARSTSKPWFRLFFVDLEQASLKRQNVRLLHKRLFIIQTRTDCLTVPSPQFYYYFKFCTTVLFTRPFRVNVLLCCSLMRRALVPCNPMLLSIDGDLSSFCCSYASPPQASSSE